MHALALSDEKLCQTQQPSAHRAVSVYRLQFRLYLTDCGAEPVQHNPDCFHYIFINYGRFLKLLSAVNNTMTDGRNFRHAFYDSDFFIRKSRNYLLYGKLVIVQVFFYNYGFPPVFVCFKKECSRPILSHTPFASTDSFVMSIS